VLIMIRCLGNNRFLVFAQSRTSTQLCIPRNCIPYLGAGSGTDWSENFPNIGLSRVLKVLQDRHEEIQSFDDFIAVLCEEHGISKSMRSKYEPKMKLADQAFRGLTQETRCVVFLVSCVVVCCVVVCCVGDGVLDL
jgi:hypothetical protein